MNTNTKNKKEYLNLATYAFHKPKTLERARAFDKLLEFSKVYGIMKMRITSMLIIHISGAIGDKNVKISVLVMLQAILSIEEMELFAS
ncbi:hypothetical protein QK908_01715 [Lactococcus cremoris]